MRVIPNPLPIQFATGNEEEHEAVPEAEQEDEEEDVEQGEPQPSPSEAAGPSHGNDDGIPPETNNQQVRRSERGRISSTKYLKSEYILLTEDGEPESFYEAISHKDKEKWLQAM